MLKGINIGGENRLDFLKFLKKKQEENLEKLENAYLFEDKIEKNKNEIIDQIDDLDDSYDNKYLDDDYLINKDSNKNEDSNNKKLINKISESNKKYDEENDYIEKELNFYNFDEELLHYRPLEIENLMKSLIDLKTALIFTSTDREVEQIINYSKSEKIFRYFKNKEGAIICQSNMGNLHSQLLKLDKAIYHLSSSLQDNNLIKFINQNLTDVFDEDDSLLKKISYSYNKEKKEDKNNRLAEKQMNSFKNNFSQKLIGILINTRYCRLIHVYYLFFKNMQKVLKSKDLILKEQFMNTKFHTINYYHKILIQFIYLSYEKNDLIKIGESILDYIEFLIKFKLKTSKEDNNYLKIQNRNRPEFKKKKLYKKKIFDKIINWFNVFDDYISYVKDNSSLGDSKCIIDDYSHSLNNENFEFNLESQTAFSFRINIQKSNFLKGKFCLYCKNYNDALFYFIRASKNESIVTDGLIKKRSLKHIYKILIKMNKKYEKLGLKNLNMNKKLKEYNREKNKIYITKNKFRKTRIDKQENIKDKHNITFGDKIKLIKLDILQDINECKAKQEKDIIILIDFNIYNINEETTSINESRIDSFIEESKVILNNYLSLNDKFGLLIYLDDYKIICPLTNVEKIDNNIFSKDILEYKNNKKIEKGEFSLNLNESNDNVDFYLGENILGKFSEEESFDMSENGEINYDKINGFIKTINYINSYIKMKEDAKSEKYIIIFSDFMNIKLENKQIDNIIKNINSNKSVIILLVGKNKKTNIKNDNIDLNGNINNYLEELILSKFGEKSEAINFENMKKIKTILSNNKVIKDEIFYPNEIYK